MSTVVITTPEAGVPELPVRRFTVEEYHRMIAAGVFETDERFELLDGWITPKMARNPAHDGTIDLLQELLRQFLPAGFRVRIQSAIVTDDSEPEPDLVVARGGPREFLDRHPKTEDIVLVIEVADTSIGRDRVQKSRIYARAGIRNYWIVNLVHRSVESYSDPSGPSPDPRYRQRRECAGNEVLAVTLDGVDIGSVTPAAIFG